MLRRRFRTGDDPFDGIGRAESDDELLDRTSAVPPSRPSQFQNGRRAGQLIGFFFFIRREEFRRRSFGFGRHQIVGRTVAHSVAGGRQREFVLAAAVQVADWDGPPSGRKDSLSPFVLLGRPTGPEFEDKRSDGRNLFGRPVVSASGHGPLDCDGRGIGCGESEVRGRRGDDDGQQIVDPILSVSVFGQAAVIASGVFCQTGKRQRSIGQHVFRLDADAVVEPTDLERSSIRSPRNPSGRENRRRWSG